MKPSTTQAILLGLLLSTGILLAACNANAQADANRLRPSESDPEPFTYRLTVEKTLAAVMYHARSHVQRDFSYRTCSECEEPRLVSGQAALELINFEKQPYSDDVLSFVRALLSQEQSRAVVQRGLAQERGDPVDIVVVPLPDDMRRPPRLEQRSSVLFDTGGRLTCDPEDRVDCDRGLRQTGGTCFCNISTCCPIEYINCEPCPEREGDKFACFPELVREEFRIDKRLLNPTPLHEIPLNASLLR